MQRTVFMFLCLCWKLVLIFEQTAKSRRSSLLYSNQRWSAKECRERHIKAEQKDTDVLSAYSQTETPCLQPQQLKWLWLVCLTFQDIVCIIKYDNFLSARNLRITICNLFALLCERVWTKQIWALVEFETLYLKWEMISIHQVKLPTVSFKI